MVAAGFVGEEAALMDIQPLAIPQQLEALLLEARPDLGLEVVRQLEWGDTPRYYMFRRRIDRWCPLSTLQSEIQRFRCGT
jgi:hypothetical protein